MKGTAIWDKRVTIPPKVKQLSFDPAIPLLGRDPGATRRDVPADSNMNVMVVLLITAQQRKQHKCPWMNECANQVWRVHTVAHYAAMRKNGSTDTCHSVGEP